MARYLLFAFSDCNDPAREAEFNDWYDNTHLPDMLGVPGMIEASRWESAEPSQQQRRKYLALYTLETDDVEEFDKQVQIKGKWTMDQERFSDLPVFDPPDIPRVYKQILPTMKAGQPGK